MGEEVDEDTAIEIAKEHADSELIGELGEILATRAEAGHWVVELRTHTFSDSYDHRLKITKAVGNIVGHERIDRSE